MQWKTAHMHGVYADQMGKDKAENEMNGKWGRDGMKMQTKSLKKKSISRKLVRVCYVIAHKETQLLDINDSIDWFNW